MKNENVEILVSKKTCCSEKGAMTPVKQYFHEGNWYVEARKGANYEIKVKNNNSGRKLFIASVDGLSVLTGKPADANSGGYVVSGYSSYNIKGFRRSNEEVNLFEFSSKEQSYAVKSPTGEKSFENCGIVAVRVYEEKPKPKPVIRYVERPHSPTPRKPWRPTIPFPDPWNPDNLPYYNDMVERGLLNSETHEGTPCTDWMEQERGGFRKMSSRAGGCSASASNAPLRSKGIMSLDMVDTPAEFDMGTKFSDEKVKDKVSNTEFDTGVLLAEVNIYYASRAALKAMGVPIEPEPAKVAHPKGFKTDFCQPPE